MDGSWAFCSIRARYAARWRIACLCTRTSTTVFVADAVERFNRVKVGLPWNPDTQMGSQIYESHLKAIQHCITLAKAGATVLCGGKHGRAGQGLLLQPTCSATSPAACVWRRTRYSGRWRSSSSSKRRGSCDHSPATSMALAAQYGHATSTGPYAASRAIETGRMWVNTYNSIPAGAPFGGHRNRASGVKPTRSFLSTTPSKKTFSSTCPEKAHRLLSLTACAHAATPCACRILRAVLTRA